MTSGQFLERQTIESLEIEALQALCKSDNARVFEIFQMIENLLIKANDYNKSIISNLFILPVTQFLELHYSWGQNYLALLPQHIKSEYRNQVNSSGI